MLFSAVCLFAATLAIPAYDIEQFQTGERRFVDLDGQRFACSQLSPQNDQMQRMKAMHEATMMAQSKSESDTQTSLPLHEHLIRVGDQVICCQHVTQLRTPSSIKDQPTLTDLNTPMYSSDSNVAQTWNTGLSVVPSQQLPIDQACPCQKQMNPQQQATGTEKLAYAIDLDSMKSAEPQMSRSTPQTIKQTLDCAKQTESDSGRDVKLEQETSIEFNSEKLNKLMDLASQKSENPTLQDLNCSDSSRLQKRYIGPFGYHHRQRAKYYRCIGLANAQTTPFMRNAYLNHCAAIRSTIW